MASLGRINYHHPAFHNEGCLFPEGYAATRTVATPASRMKPAPHRCTVEMHPSGSGPLFRYGHLWLGHMALQSADTPSGCAA